MTGYHSGRNSVEGLPFQISQNLPQPLVPFHQQITPEELQKLVDLHPYATLHQLCQLVQEQRGITLSTTAMCRLIKFHNIPRRKGQYQASLALTA